MAYTQLKEYDTTKSAHNQSHGIEKIIANEGAALLQEGKNLDKYFMSFGEHISTLKLRRR